METAILIISLLAVGLLIGGIIYFSTQAAKKRAAGMATYAAANGWQKIEDTKTTAILANLPLISGRYTAAALNSYSRIVGSNWFIYCDFVLQRGTGKGREYYVQTGLIATGTDLIVPHFAMTYRSMLTALLPKGNGEEVVFADSPGFAAKYLVKSPTAIETQAFLTPATLAALESTEKLWMIGHGNAVAVFEPFKPAKIANFSERLQTLEGILSLLAAPRP